MAAEVRAEMARKNKRAADLAALLRCSKPTAYNRMAGLFAFTVDELPVVAAWLGVTVKQWHDEIERRGGVASPEPQVMRSA